MQTTENDQTYHSPQTPHKWQRSWVPTQTAQTSFRRPHKQAAATREVGSETAPPPKRTSSSPQNVQKCQQGTQNHDIDPEKRKPKLVNLTTTSTRGEATLDPGTQSNISKQRSVFQSDTECSQHEACTSPTRPTCERQTHPQAFSSKKTRRAAEIHQAPRRSSELTRRGDPARLSRSRPDRPQAWSLRRRASDDARKRRQSSRARSPRRTRHHPK